MSVIRIPWRELAESRALNIERFDALHEVVGFGRTCILAGGALRRLLIGGGDSDWDLFPLPDQRPEDALLAAGATKQNESGLNTTWKLSLPVGEYIAQVVRMPGLDSPEAVIDAFDFTICQFALDGETFYTTEWALIDLARRRLAVHRVTFATSSVRRMLKYGRQGFSVCQGAIGQLLQSVAANPRSINSNVEYVD